MHDAPLLQMGLSPLRAARWIEPDGDYLQMRQHKLRTRERLDACVYQALPQSRDAQTELARALQTYLLHHHSNLYGSTANGLVYLPTEQALCDAAAEPLWQSSLWIADDLLLLQASEGTYRLTAASLCSPSHWRLEEKMGLPLVDIHAPVPGLRERIGAKIERFMAHLKPSHPVERFNWSLQADDALCARAPQPDYVDAATELFYRTERQTLRRLPQTGAIVFTIRVYLHSLSALQQVPHCLARLRSAIASAPPAMAQYKHFATYQAALEKYRGDTR
jgi:hypothetical protein